MDPEQEALSLVWAQEGKTFTYQGPETFYQGKTGVFTVLSDMNCCGATDAILFSFDCGDCRKVLDPLSLPAFFQDCRPADES